MKSLMVFLWPLLTLPAMAKPAQQQAPVDSIISAQVAKQFAELGGSPKALKHLSCIMRQQRTTRFGLKEIKKDKDASDRCNRVEGGKAEISIHRDDYALVVDFTRKPTERRMFLVPITGKGNVEAYFTGHGRFGNTPRDNEKFTENKSNSISTLKIFSNKPNSNASATGLFIAGKTYIGKYDGPKKEVTKTVKKTIKDKDGKKKTVEIKKTYTVKADPKNPRYSLVLHGVETEVNDNACRRATVIHGTSKISENGKEAGVHLMSSGCPMVDYQAVNRITERLKGSSSEGGAAILAYGPREAELEDDFYCELRPGQKPDQSGDKKEDAGQDDEDVEHDNGQDDENDLPVSKPAETTAAATPAQPAGASK